MGYLPGGHDTTTVCGMCSNRHHGGSDNREWLVAEGPLVLGGCIVCSGAAIIVWSGRLVSNKLFDSAL